MKGDSGRPGDNTGKSPRLTPSETCRQTQSDLELASAIVARDRKATARLVEMHSDEVHRYVWRRLTPKIDSVDDLVQEVFVAAWRGIRNYSGESPLRTWLLGIARNKVEDHYRKTLSLILVDLESEGESLAAPSVDLVAGIDASVDAGRAARILASMPPEYSTALRWRYWEARSAREMAAASGRSEKAVERLLARARERFKTMWEKGGSR
jgi:RNA polymerase sigma-70 factor, ECF subfamily